MAADYSMSDLSSTNPIAESIMGQIVGTVQVFFVGRDRQVACRAALMSKSGKSRNLIPHSTIPYVNVRPTNTKKCATAYWPDLNKAIFNDSGSLTVNCACSLKDFTYVLLRDQ